MNNYIIRELRPNEVCVLEDFLYEAIFQPDDNNPLPRDVIKKPEISVYIDNWGEKDDLCLVAVVDDIFMEYIMGVASMIWKHYAISCRKRNFLSCVLLNSVE